MFEINVYNKYSKKKHQRNLVNLYIIKFTFERYKFQRTIKKNIYNKMNGKESNTLYILSHIKMT